MHVWLIRANPLVHVLQANTLPNGMTNKLVNQKNHSLCRKLKLCMGLGHEFEKIRPLTLASLKFLPIGSKKPTFAHLAKALLH